MSGYKDKVADAIGMALQHVRLCAPDATVDAALEQAARDFRELAEQRAELLAAARLVICALQEDEALAGKDDDYIYDTLGSALSGAYLTCRAAIAKCEGGAR